jgi:hypothetical protein
MFKTKFCKICGGKYLKSKMQVVEKLVAYPGEAGFEQCNYIYYCKFCAPIYSRITIEMWAMGQTRYYNRIAEKYVETLVHE